MPVVCPFDQIFRFNGSSTEVEVTDKLKLNQLIESKDGDKFQNDY